MSAASFKLQLPPKSLFKFPPDPYPVAIPPPTDARTFASPFPIPAKIFNDVLDWRVPVTIGSVYMISAIIMNKINRDRGNKPWAISKTKAFHYFVLVHNIFLAIFSALTFIGMIRALAHSWPGRRDLTFFGKLWPGLRTENSLAGAADALCKLHGPRDLGEAVFYNSAKNAWTTKSHNVKLGAMKTPDDTDVGRLWNEGLAFWGWWFYLSKFYEVFDTIIILAKGKRSSTLQTYHHTGAMACMWAGIRFMSPPIWMFAFINSGIHALMYTYYTLSALRIRVPQGIKRTLTTMQITQFLIGITFATLHLFVHYSIPVRTSYTKTVGSAVSAGASAVSAAVSGAASRAPEAAAAAIPSIGSYVKKVLLRAAGEEGMAQRLSNPTAFAQLPKFLANATESAGAHQTKTSTHWRTHYEYVPCIDTTGQAFAIWLNVFYLAPLTLLFVRFFIRSYYRRSAPSSKPSNQSARISKAAEEAAKGTNREMDSFGKAVEDGAYDLVNNGMDQIKRTASNTKKSAKKNANNGSNQQQSPNAKGKSSKTNSGSETLTDGQARKNAKSQDKQDVLDRSVSSQDSEVSSKAKHSNIDHPQTPQSQSQSTDYQKSLKEGGAKLQGYAEEKATVVKEMVGEQASNAAENVKELATEVKSKVEESMSESKFSEMGSFSMVDKQEVDASTSGLQKKKDDDSQGKVEDSSSLVEDIDSGSAPTFSEVANSDESTEFSTSTSLDGHKVSNPSYAEVADPNEETHVSTPTKSKADTQSRSDSASSDNNKRSRSPSKKSKGSKIPQAKNRQSTSPVKKPNVSSIISPAKTTTSMAAHSGAAIIDKNTSTGNE